MTRRRPGDASTLVQLRREMRWRRACPALLTSASLFGVVAPLLKAPDLNDEWAEHLAQQVPEVEQPDR